MGGDDLIAIMTPGMSASALTFTRRTVGIERLLADRWGEKGWGGTRDPIEFKFTREAVPLPQPALATIITDHRLGLLHLALIEQNPPAVVTESMSAANDRAKAIRQMEALPTLLDGKLQAAALASPTTLRSLRRRLGKFRY